MIRAERDVKHDVTSYLLTLQRPHSGVQCYFRMPVPVGYGKSGLDYEGCINGWFFAIETKAPRQWLTPRQRDVALEMLAAGGKVFVISSTEGLDAFKMWVSRCQRVSAELAASHCRKNPN
jgi:hypothetical protein